VAQLRDYLDVLDTLLSGAVVSHSGPYYRVENAQLAGAGTYGTGRPSILVSAMGPEMLKLAGSHTDGTITANTGPRTLESHIVPTIRAAAADAGRPEPRVVATVQLALTSDPDAVRARLTPVMSGYRDMPSYRAMLDREGVEHPVDLVVAGDERTLHAALMRLRDVGVTDVLAAPVDPTTRRATKECLAALAGLV
jgi:alkanesulfonate monooxygenase SsuD/methylene tetrahydromethanopterin reductase-like flavin-dependent oxidoreductase (luciferase family)